MNKDIDINIELKSIKSIVNNILIEANTATLYINEEYDTYWFDLINIKFDLFLEEILNEIKDEYLLLKVRINAISCTLKSENKCKDISLDLNDFSTLTLKKCQVVKVKTSDLKTILEFGFVKKLLDKLPSIIPSTVIIDSYLNKTCLTCLSSQLNSLVKSYPNIKLQITSESMFQNYPYCKCKTPESEPMIASEFLHTFIELNLISSLSLALQF